MRFTLPLAALLLAQAASACDGSDHAHADLLQRRSQRGATQPSGPNSLVRPLTWGDVNILHTTDIHGYYQGHLKSSQPEPNYSADFGDYASFVEHMRTESRRRKVDLFVVDSGDLHDGAGITDGVPSGQIAGEYGDAVHAKVRYDVLAVGNHELYNYTIARNVYEKFVPTQNGRYLASNVNLTIPDAQGNNQSVPLGNRFVKFKSYWGKKVTALGVLYNFAGADKGITVQKVADMVKESWFLDAISEQPDLFILAGHMPVRKDNWPTVIAAIRAKHPDTPILVAGGHTHIRDFVKYDTTAVGIESGRYLETIGWLSANSTGFPFAHVPTSPPKPLPPSGPVGSNFAFSRSYIDANRRNYALHANLAPWRFDTPAGLRISKDLQATADAWDLTKSYGTAPQDYYLNRVSPSDSHALLNLLTNQVLPTVISTSNPDRQGVASIVLANSGSQRADLYAGDFTKNDQYIVSPFLDAFLYIKDVPYQYAQQVVGQLNKAGAYRRSISSGSPLHQTLFSSDEPRTDESYAQGEVEPIYQAWRQSQFRAATEEQRRSLAQLDARADEQATLGYVTSDDAGNDGDDTVHLPLPYAAQPDYVQSPPAGNTTALTSTSAVDVVFVDFIQGSVISILNNLQKDKTYSASDVTKYNSLTTQDLYSVYAAKAWKQAA